MQQLTKYENEMLSDNFFHTRYDMEPQMKSGPYLSHAASEIL